MCANPCPMECGPSASLREMEIFQVLHQLAIEEYGRLGKEERMVSQHSMLIEALEDV